ncbi:MAG: phosphatase PAP2 family protein [Gemmatimonadales bacterium]|nr:phosphatase PAP2 family protein [Gemmatimonadales bacterium]
MPLLTRPCRSCVACALAFILISPLVMSGALTAVDDQLLRAVGAMRTDIGTVAMRGISALGDGLIEVPIAFGLMALLWRAISRAVAWRYFGCAITGELAYVIAKSIFQRPRPDVIDRLGSAGWHSYPSGHAMLAPIVYSVALLLLLRVVRGRAARAGLVILAVLIPFTIALSRVYLGVHYPSDVTAALVLGSGWGLLWFGRDPDGKCVPTG